MSGYFGAMLDMSRNAVMKPEEVKKYARLLKSLGYNMIQLYTEDTYEVDGEPYFGYLRGRYSQEELKEVVSYCEGLDMEVIPCIQTLAHLNQIFRWRAYEPMLDCADILGVEVLRPAQVETTALGACALAGLTVGLWKDKQEIKRLYAISNSYTPTMSQEEREEKIKKWRKCVGLTRAYATPEK